MEPVAKYLLFMSAAVIFLLGFTHLVITFYGPKLLPRDADLQQRMNTVSPTISRDTTMWRAWIGFNASHSFGAILFGLVYGYLAIIHSELLFSSLFLLVVGLAFLVGYTALAIKYWFSIPFRGIVAALVLYIVSIAASLV